METSGKENKQEFQSTNFVNDLHSRIHEDIQNKSEHHGYTGRVLAGLLIVAVGSVLLAKEMGVVFPAWLFAWPMILIVLGIYIGAKHSFRRGGWIGLIVIGTAFLINDFMPELSFRQYIWPVVIIGAGLFMVLRPRRKKNDISWPTWNSNQSYSGQSNPATDDFIDSVSVFGGNKKNVFSKDFKGGDVVICFGGMELNLSQADVTQPAVLEVTQFFGGTKLVVPANWKIRSEITTVFGSFEDKRMISKDMPDTDKILVLTGTCVFGGIDVRSY